MNIIPRGTSARPDLRYLANEPECHISIKMFSGLPLGLQFQSAAEASQLTVYVGHLRVPTGQRASTRIRPSSVICSSR